MGGQQDGYREADAITEDEMMQMFSLLCIVLVVTLHANLSKNGSRAFYEEFFDEF